VRRARPGDCGQTIVSAARSAYNIRVGGERRRRLVTPFVVSGVALGCALGAAGCGGSLGASGTEPPTPPASASLCGGAGWTSLGELGVQEGGPASLAMANGNLYFAVDQPPTIVSLPVTGGTPTAIANVPTSIGVPWQVWIAGDALDFAVVDDKLWQVPLAGGSPTLVADGMVAFLPPSYAVPTALAFTGDELYFDLWPQEGTPFWSLWRMPAAGGAAEKLADLPLPTPTVNWHALATNAESVIVAFDNFPDVGAYAVPLAGGPPAELPHPPTVGPEADEALLGIGPSAILWSTLDATGTSLSVTDLSDPNAPVLRPFWPDRPASFQAIGIESWPDGSDGAWIVTGWEPFDDGMVHTSLWSIDAQGHAARLGCDPTPGAGIVSSVLATPSALYAVVGSQSTSLYDYSVVRLDR
jgi:hypothetical protein